MGATLRVSEGHLAIGALILFSGWLFVGLPLLTYPSERIVYRDSPQEAAQPSQEPAGSAQSPFFVQVMPAPKSARERAEEAEDREKKRSADLWLVRWTFALFAATVGLIFATGVLGWFGFRQSRDMKASIGAAQSAARAAEDQLALSRDALVTTERAFVFCERVDARWTARKETEEISGWTFVIIWKNSGKTPTKRARSNSNSWIAIDAGDLPGDFDFPDYDRESPNIMIGPNAVMHSGHFAIPIDTLQKLHANRGHAYLWGWCDYDDTFAGTQRHRAEFCFEIVVTGNPIYKEGGFAYRMRGPFNGFDEDCYRKPKPYQEEQS